MNRAQAWVFVWLLVNDWKVFFVPKKDGSVNCFFRPTKVLCILALDLEELCGGF